MLNFLLAQNPSVPGAPKILPDCAAAGCTSLSSVSELFGNIAVIVLGLTGTVMLAVFVYGGVMYLTSRGNPASIQKATKALSGAVVGLAIVFGAWTVITYGVNALKGQDPFLVTEGGKYVVCTTKTSRPATSLPTSEDTTPSSDPTSNPVSSTASTLGEACGPGSVCIGSSSGDEVCVEEGGEQHANFLRSQAEAASTESIGEPSSETTDDSSIIDALEALRAE